MRPSTDPLDPSDIGPGSEAIPERGYMDPALGEELAGLMLRYLIVDRGSGRSPRAVKERLKLLSDRFGGAQAINLRHKPIPWAYRVFYRHIGLDPDEQRTPIEQLAFERMKAGRFRSRNLLDDALTIAVVETGVAMRAFDADRITGRLGIRAAGAGEQLEGRPGELPSGTLVIADERRAVALLFGATGSGRGVSPASRRTILAAIQVAGVPDISVEEAIWVASEILRH